MWITLLLSSLMSLAATPPSAAEVLAAVDRNMTYDSRAAELEMTVTKGRRIKVYEMDSFGRGADEAALEFEGPARDKGTKMLKQGGELWMYLPSIEKTQRLSGHMLRDSLMGSHLSYEDILQATQLGELYTATVIGEETVEGRACWKLELTARDASVAYPRRLSWVDQEHMIPVKEDLYAASGTLLKSWTLTGVRDFDGRKFPTRWVVEDRLQEGASTVLVFEELQFSIPLEEEIFSQRWLAR